LHPATAAYWITSENLALRRRFIGLSDDVVQLLGQLQPWAEEVSPVCCTIFHDSSATLIRRSRPGR
jgi:hypothetical protein